MTHQSRYAAPIESHTAGSKLKCVRCGKIFPDEWPTFPEPFRTWGVPTCPHCNAPRDIEVQDGRAVSGSSTSDDAPRHPPLTTWDMVGPEAYGPRCPICERPILARYQICIKCRRELGLASIPYRDWPEWLKESCRLARANRQTDRDYLCGWSRRARRQPFWDTQYPGLLRCEPYADKLANSLYQDAIKGAKRRDRYFDLRTPPKLIHFGDLAPSFTEGRSDDPFAEDLIPEQTGGDEPPQTAGRTAKLPEWSDMLAFISQLGGGSSASVPDSASEGLAVSTNPETLLVSAETRSDLRKMLADLPPLHQLLIRLLLADLTPRDMVRYVGLEQSECSSQLNRALAMLRKKAVSLGFPDNGKRYALRA